MSSMTGSGFMNQAHGLRKRAGLYHPGQFRYGDVLRFHGDGSIHGFIPGAQMTGSGYNNSAWNFRSVQSNSTGGHDAAFLFGASSGNNQLSADKDSATYSNAGFSNTVTGFETVNVSGNASATDSAIMDNVVLDSGHTNKPLDGIPYNHCLYLNNFEELSTTATPNNTTPTPHAVDQVMTAYWP